MAETPPPRVFISYSHDNAGHKERVLSLADRLRAEGIDASIDQYIQSPPEGWASWCAAEIRIADFVLMVCTDAYRRRVDRMEEPGKGHGVLWEARLIQQHLYDEGSASTRFVPVLFADGTRDDVPAPVRSARIYLVESADEYEGLYRLLTGQPATPPPPIGPRKLLPPRQRPSSNKRAPRVFLCYFREDSDFVSGLEKQLHALGIQTWQNDTYGLDRSPKPRSLIERVIQMVDYVIVIQSKAGEGREESAVFAEVQSAVERQLRISPEVQFLIPTRIDNTEYYACFPRRLHTIDLSVPTGGYALAALIKRDWAKRTIPETEDL